MKTTFAILSALLLTGGLTAQRAAAETTPVQTAKLRLNAAKQTSRLIRRANSIIPFIGGELRTQARALGAVGRAVTGDIDWSGSESMQASFGSPDGYWVTLTNGSAKPLHVSHRGRIKYDERTDLLGWSPSDLKRAIKSATEKPVLLPYWTVWM